MVNLATLGPVGRRLPAPGTWGSLIGALAFAAAPGPLYRPELAWPDGAMLAGTFLLMAVAVVICGAAERRLGRKDPGEVILDEFAVMPLCFLGWRHLAAWPGWAILLAGFALFRVYDILKPLGIRRLQALPGGWGVVADDVAAALAACATLHLLGRML